MHPTDVLGRAGGGQASEMPNDAKHHASVLACKDTQLGDSNVRTI